MMTSEQGSMPEPGEIVVCTVREITSHGIYIKIDQYGGMNGFLHVSEISTGWVRNIERVAKPQQRLVLKVIRADRTRKEIDLSLRQVTNEERRAKVIEWKRAERAQAIMNAVRKKVSLEEKQLNECVTKMVGQFGSLYAALEMAAKKGEKAFAGLELPQEFLTVVVETATEKIVPPKYEIGAIVEASSKAPDGGQQIKKTLLAAASSSPGSAEIKITYAGAPRHRIRITGGAYKQAAKTTASVPDRVKDGLGEHGALNFRR